VALAAQHNTFIPVIVGTTLGMMIANIPAVLVGNHLANQIPVCLVHRVAAVIFALLGVATLFGAGERFGL
jgi:putative Ca2+/H+ antiporter (TMEM165/GDT1 family)